jgi:hypothetical protein
MYGNTPNQWSGSLKGYKRLRFIINCLTRMRMLDRDLRLNFTHSGPPWPAHKNLLPWYRSVEPAWSGTRVRLGTPADSREAGQALAPGYSGRWAALTCRRMTNELMQKGPTATIF